MNESPSLPHAYDGQAHADPDALQKDLLERFPAYAFESECQRSLDMIALCQRYLSHLAQDRDGPEADEMRQTLSDLAVAANRLDRNLSSLTSLLRCAQHTEAPQWEPVELRAFAQTLCAEQELLQKYAPAPGEEPADDTASLAMSGVELAAVFDKLPLRDAALFSMRYDEGYTAAELAKMTGEPAATIRTRLHRIRKHLQQTLKED